MPISSLYDLRVEEFALGRAVCSIPASEWFCMLGGDVSLAMIAALADCTGWTAAMTWSQPGWSVVGLDGNVRFFRTVRPDGRRIRAEANRHSGQTFFEMESVGQPSRWNTLRGLRVRKWWERGG